MIRVYVFGTLIALCIVLSVTGKVLYDKVCTLQEQNKTLQRALETNLQAIREKEVRNNEELQQLHNQITNLRKIKCKYMHEPVDADVRKWLQQLQESYTGTISITIAE